MSISKKLIVFLMILTVFTAVLSGCKTATVSNTPTAAPAATEAPAAETVEEDAENVKEEAEAPAETAEEAPAEESAAEDVPAEAPSEEPVSGGTAAAAEETVETSEEPAADAEKTAETAGEPSPEADTEQPAAAVENAVASVDGNGISAEAFTELATFNRYQYQNMYNQYAQMYSMYGMPLDSINQQVEGILGESGKQTLGLEVIDQLTYNKVLDLEAEEAGISNTDQEIYARMKTMFGYEDPDASEEPLGMESFNIVDEDSRNETFKSYAELILNSSYDGKVSFDFLKDYTNHILLDNKMFDAELEKRVFEAEMVSARHILVDDEETAKDILAKLEAGEDWNALASEHSKDTSNKDNGGNLGWFGRGMMVPEFENAAYALEPGEISEPVKTNYGYHIIASDGKETRPLEGDALAAAQDELYTEWTVGLREKHDIQTYEDVWMDAVPMEPAFVPVATEAPAEETVTEETSEETSAEAPAEETVTEETVAEAPAEAPAEETVTEEAVEEAPAEAPAEETVTEEAVEEAPAEAPAEDAAAENAVEETPVSENDAQSEDLAAAAAAAVAAVSSEETPAEVPTEETTAEEVVSEAPAEEIVTEKVAEAAPAEETVKEADSSAAVAEVPAETVENAVASVDGNEISAEDFTELAIFNRYQYQNMYNQYAQMYSMYGMPVDSLNQQVEGILGESGKQTLGQEVLDQLTYNKVLELEAEEAGISNTKQDVYARLKTMFGYEDPDAAEELLGMESFNIVDEDSLNAVFQRYAEMILDSSYGGKVSFDFMKNYADHILLDNKLFDGELEKRVFEAEMVSARHILVDDEETAKDILAKLEAGEDWNALASEHSKDTANKDKGGDLGWFGRGRMVPEFENAAFALEPGQISDPVKTNYGYHIIASDGKEMRPLEGEALAAAQEELYTEWTAELREKHDIQTYEDVWMEAVPMEPAFVPVVTEAPAEAPAEETVTEETVEEVPAEAPAEETVTEETVEEAPSEAPAEETVTEEAVEEAPAEAPAEETVTGETVDEAPASEPEAQAADLAAAAAAAAVSVDEAPAEETVTEEASFEPADEENTAEEAVTEAPAEKAAEETPFEAADEEIAAEETVTEPSVEETVTAEANEDASFEAADEKAAAEEVSAEPQTEETVSEEVPAETNAEDLYVVALVDGKPITAGEFKELGTLARYQNLASYQQIAQMYAAYGMPLDDLNQQAESFLGEGSKETFGQGVLDQLIQNRIVRLEAEKAGISITDEEVTAMLKDAYGYTEETEEAPIAGMDSFNLTEDESQAQAAKDAEFRANMEMMFEMEFDGKISYDFYHDLMKTNMLEQALFEKELENRVFEEEMVNARHILVEDEQTANDIVLKLNNGEDFAALAEQYSIDTGSAAEGGSLGWFGRGVMVPEFEEAAFALEPGEISAPVQSDFGYHIILSEGKEIRPMEDYALEAAQEAVYTEWSEGLRENHDVFVFDNVWKNAIPMTPAFEPVVIETPAEGEAPAIDIAPVDEAVSGSEEAAPEAGIVVEEDDEDDDVDDDNDDEDDDDDDELTINNTEQADTAYLLNNDAEITAAESAGEEELTINNTEQTDSAYLLNNDAEIAAAEAAGSEQEATAAPEAKATPTAEQTENLLNNDAETKK